MKQLFIVVTVAAVFLGCQTTTTGEPGIRYGMTKADVVQRISRSDKMISTDGDSVVTEGMFDSTKQAAQKTFMFRDGKLVEVKYVITSKGILAPGSSIGFTE